MVKYLRPSDMFDYQRAFEEKRRAMDGDRWFIAQTWACRSCGAVFTVSGDRDPEHCACGSYEIEPDLTGA